MTGPFAVLTAMLALLAVALAFPGRPQRSQRLHGVSSPSRDPTGPASRTRRGGVRAGAPTVATHGETHDRPGRWMRAATRETERDDGVLRRGRALAAGLAGAGLALLLGGLLGVVLGVVAAGAVWRGSSGVEPRNVRRRRQELRRSLPAVVDLMASSLAVGLSTSSALEAVVRAVDDPMRSELRAIAGALELGVDPVVVWGGIDAGSELAPLGRCLARAIETGAAVSESLHRLGLDLRREERAAVEDRARAVGVQAAVPLGLCLLPAFLLVGVVPLVAAAVTELLGR